VDSYVPLGKSSVTLSEYYCKHGMGRRSVVLETRNRGAPGLNPGEFTLCVVFSCCNRSVQAMSSGYLEIKLCHAIHVKVTLVVTSFNFFWGGGG
jgi:hypothetical protein